MYYGQAILSELYLDNIFNHTQMILDSENFINSLYEAEGNKENFLVRILKFIKEKIIAVINTIKNVYKWIVTKIKEFKDKHSKSKLDDVKIVGATKDEETADEVINNFKDAVNKANEEVKSAAKDMEDTKANVANNIKERHDILNQYMKDVTESIKKNTESFEDSQSNIDEMLKDIDDSLNDLLDDEDKSTSKNLPAVAGKEKKFAILVNNNEPFKFIHYDQLADSLLKMSKFIEQNSNNVFFNVFAEELDTEAIFRSFRRYIFNSVSYEDAIKILYSKLNDEFVGNATDFESFKEVVDRYSNSKSIYTLYSDIKTIKERYSQYYQKNKLNSEYNMYALKTIERTIDNLEKIYSKISTTTFNEFNNIDNDKLKNKIIEIGGNENNFKEFISNTMKIITEQLKLMNYLNQALAKCIADNNNQYIQMENWLYNHLRFIYY